MPRKSDTPTTPSDQASPNSLDRRSLVKAGAGLALGSAFTSMATSEKAQAQTQAKGPVIRGDEHTLILASHPYPERSVVNKALWEVAEQAEGSIFKNLESIHGDDMWGFDRAAERKLYQQVDRIVMMFPIHWFNLTPMLKAYMNEIWWIGAPSELRGVELLVVTTTAGGPDAYQPDGRLGFTIEQVLTPLQASARYTGMTFSEPLAFLGAAGAGPDELTRYQGMLADRLSEPPRSA
ncbi:Putative NADPH-quinone reductase (modulator of drug activity B) [Cohaesibacter marisflavi]|uniref:Putative NADPH-quinone reductase (Modulator of drug activity B) n=1 Tax=Cohaesibacter marisflavi TaxID=655353 RepID=A0A1I4ZBS5_9HYPH|nr:NAD(P)H-dependent oxidoreductase [Cohaesibacter marisflavi]SFN47724.1 Putative NADPH-quinone reductase (modulator of drug activity B) [Cohaesibacter marisflavi]